MRGKGRFKFWHIAGSVVYFAALAVVFWRVAFQCSGAVGACNDNGAAFQGVLLLGGGIAIYLIYLLVLIYLEMAEK